ncbi:MAG: glycogen synthase GlgA [Rhodoferax sp.]|nr:glycogen synthase GlgA [Rhodoferax sp.]
MNVLQVSAEIFPLLKTGGLADVAGALPQALNAAGCEVRVLLPGFAPILADLQGAKLLTTLHAPWGEMVALRQGRLTSLGLQAYVIDVPTLYHRAGSPYADEQGQPFTDNDRRFALLGWVAARLTAGLDSAWQPRVVHSHDWHAALAGAYLAYLPPQRQRVASVYTVHNLAYQGLFAPRHFFELGLPASAFAVDGLEFHGQLSFMKAGLYYADHITTVSPTYAREIQTPEQGCGLDGLLRTRAADLSGILNGVDEAVWDPAHDAALAARYDARNPEGKKQCKAELQRLLGLSVAADAPLFGVVSRLTEQKGLHLVLGVIDELIARGGQLVVLGAGDAALQTAFAERAKAHPASVSVRIGYDEPYAHQIFGATDVTLVPSRFEPCGLTQMYGLKYGSLPLVHRVGGLADTVMDCSLENLAEGSANGFVFSEFDVPSLSRAVARAFALYDQPAQWRKVRARAMRQRLDWSQAASQYLALYQRLCH